MTGPEVTAAMKAKDVDAALVEKALAAAFRMPDGYAEAHPGVMSDLKVAYGDQYRAALAAVLPEIQAQAKTEALTEARKVISQYLATAESWRHARVMWAFAIMLGEIPEDTPEPESPADERLTAATVIEPRDAQRSRAAAQDDDGDPSWAATEEPS